jgi:nucleotide sugar dehydrogenase
VVGGLCPASLARAKAFYSEYLGATINDVGTIEAAEMTKLAGMLYRDVNIALANELAAFCEVAGLDFGRVREAANGDGEAAILVPGIGVGGHCTPVYPYFLTRESRRLGLPQRISEAARNINDAQPARQLARIEAFWGRLKGQSVHILGLGFRPDVKVDTLSPAYALREELQARGAMVSIEDPHYSDEELRAAGFSPGSIAGSKIAILNTAHSAFAAPDFSAWRAAGVEVVLDGRNLWKQEAAEAAGLHYFGIGRSARQEQLAQQRRAAAPAPTLPE